MPAHPKLTAARRRHLFAVLEAGLPLSAAARAIDVSVTAIHKRAARDPAFAARLAVVRGKRAAVEPDDWQRIAASLEAAYPERWAPPSLQSDPLPWED